MTPTYTYDPFASDKDRVRFHAGDTDIINAIWSDQAITAAISEFGSWQSAVVGLLESRMAALSHESNFKADWLTLNVGEIAGKLQKLIDQKRSEFGLASGVSTVSNVQPTRSDYA